MSRNIDFTQKLSKADQNYADERPWLREEAIRSGLIDSDGNVLAADEIDDEEDEETYEDLTVKDLVAEIDARNEDREDDAKIDKGDGKKATLISALEADDEAQAESEDDES